MTYLRRSLERLNETHDKYRGLLWIVGFIGISASAQIAAVITRHLSFLIRLLLLVGSGCLLWLLGRELKKLWRAQEHFRPLIKWAAAAVGVSALTLLTATFVTVREQTNAPHFSEDFEDEVSLETWSNSQVGTTPSGRQFLGEFGPETVSLHLEDLPAHDTVQVSFDLFIIRSWDGSDSEHGPDLFQIAIGQESPFFAATFGNGVPQSYPAQWESGSESPPRTGAKENDSLGYVWRDMPKDSVYRIDQTVDHDDADLDLHFSAVNLGPITDESWGLDNVEVRTLSE